MAATKDTDIRILLVGRTGHGKSSTANSIIGRNNFKVSDSAMSVTTTTEWSNICHRFGRSVEVVDTPGIFDTYRTEEDIHKELIKSLLYTTPGFHAIAFVLEKGRFTDELVKTKDLFFSWFGSDVEKFACIILTHAEDERAVDKYLSGDIPSDLNDLVKRCGGRIAPIDNKAEQKKKDKQVECILRMVEKIKHSNENTHFSNVAFQLATQYAYNKCSQQISTQSIQLLRDAGVKMKLTETECSMLDTIFEIKNDQNHETGSDVVIEKPRASRRDRKVDINSVYFEPRIPVGMSTIAHDEQHSGNQSFDTAVDNRGNSSCNVDIGYADVDPLYKLKDDVSKGKTSEKGLFNHLRDLWIRGKKKLKCTIL